jgi:hypothetical protein
MIFGLSLLGPLPGQMQRAEDLVLCPGNGTRVSAQVAPQRCPILCTSDTILPSCSSSGGRFFVMNF